MNNYSEEEEEEEFYESLDRILSSSCSSTSASDDDADPHRRRRHLPRFPPPSAVFLDVWISEPASVEERRQRLLQQLGLAGDPALARRKAPASDVPAGGARTREGDIGRSVSCDGVCPRPASASSSAAAFGRSRSEGSVYDHQQQLHQLSLPVSGKPPLVGRTRPPSAGNLDVDVDPRCLIRNLDNGSEFVVKEFREDGMWNKLREVGTGRQLTIEEFEMCVGRSPIVQELMRRQKVVGSSPPGSPGGAGSTGGMTSKKRGSWLRSIKNVAGSVVAGGRNRRSSDDKDTSSEKGGRRSSSATDDSQEGSHSVHHGPERTKVRQYGKSHKELTGLFMSQEIQAHNGSIWTIKFSLDGQYLASAGEDCVIHVWEVVEYERKGELLVDREDNGSCNPFVSSIINGSPEPTSALACVEGHHWEKKRRAKVPGSRKSASSDHLMVPDHMFALLEKPVCSFRGHRSDVLDLSWSKSQYLLSSSMDKTVRLWHMSSYSCLKTFSHSDYVTCIQFNPVDDRYFISGSLDEKVRIWSIPDRQIVDWNDLHEMVTAACYTPDGQGALVGSHRGSCHLYDTSGFRNRSSQISACVTANGKYVICASEDSHVYVWNYDDDSRPGRSKAAVAVTQSYEHFHCRDVTVAVTWPNTIMGGKPGVQRNGLDGVSKANPQLLDGRHSPLPAYRHIDTNAANYGDKVSATWPEELMTASRERLHDDAEIFAGGMPGQSRAAWGLVIVAAGGSGEIRTFENFGFPVRA
ncbi:WD repeat-containing protein 44-like isoform X2 [Phoenix dactylifera]|uniref:WD repeat-containing protein 44-like isoform X2 n=1 Tax=Phoenix dactylifera TaxID=42345 RepID=A0A8B9AHR1_PHODC|nr:WD repeat-containing protein 44-like isoform X2 [Phoenix dactylifera]